MRDNVFVTPKKFEFDSEVASVFDDMLVRSIPFYKETMELISKLILKNASKNSKVLDIGCSTGNMLLNLVGNKELSLTGIDSSLPMIQRARQKADAYGIKCEFIHKDCLEYAFVEFDFIVCNYTMQFIQLEKRKQLLSKISRNLSENGFFIMSEKIVFEDENINKDITEIYYEFKKQNGYSELEIANKKEALENVLVPLTLKQNEELLLECGFNNVDIIFKWGNFVVFLCK
ncbi:MAG: tRNA (uridine-5-oxyacetic acid methyl ester) 34 synthase [uncultured Campylobacterales bacterium]|uniref:Carboxy-S-adenosyl-L-methionine synthase n=1 Tax=uncultured Campylobacterales bacterium TaxID=352960 RepID=A0A6S6S435_9BACT|nr:MAG: tRNA (uridine-5-oxyacetic acid methyl ester) 34 synthase [uncultured Campylobacterales bacterium]